MEIVRVENLSKQYGSGETAVKALNNVSFSVNKGEFVAISMEHQAQVNLPYYICLGVWTDLQVEKFLLIIQIYIT